MNSKYGTLRSLIDAYQRDSSTKYINATLLSISLTSYDVQSPNKVALRVADDDNSSVGYSN